MRQIQLEEKRVSGFGKVVTDYTRWRRSTRCPYWLFSDWALFSLVDSGLGGLKLHTHWVISDLLAIGQLVTFPCVPVSDWLLMAWFVIGWRRRVAVSPQGLGESLRHGHGSLAHMMGQRQHWLSGQRSWNYLSYLAPAYTLAPGECLGYTYRV